MQGNILAQWQEKAGKNAPAFSAGSVPGVPAFADAARGATGAAAGGVMNLNVRPDDAGQQPQQGDPPPGPDPADPNAGSSTPQAPETNPHQGQWDNYLRGRQYQARSYEDEIGQLQIRLQTLPQDQFYQQNAASIMQTIAMRQNQIRDLYLQAQQQAGYYGITWDQPQMGWY